VFCLLIAFNYYPPILGLLRAFYRWRPGVQAQFVGLQHFRTYFTSPETGRELVNMTRLLLFSLFTGVVVPFLMAEMILWVRSKQAKELYRLLLVIPMLVPGIVITLLWRKIYDPNLGPINTILEAIGLEAWALNWLGDTSTALYAIMFMGFPWVSGVGTLIYLGGLGQISGSIFDACEVDGCGGIRRMLQIDLPLVMGQVRLQTVLAVINGITSFQTILVLTDGGPGFATMVPGLTMFHKAFRTQQFGYSASIGMLLFLLTMGTTVLVNRSMQPFVEEVER
jgi:ABC-type sugar transport system permease subunit